MVPQAGTWTPFSMAKNRKGEPGNWAGERIMIGAAFLWAVSDFHPRTTPLHRVMGPMLSELPPEMLEQVLASLPPADILKMKQV